MRQPIERRRFLSGAGACALGLGLANGVSLGSAKAMPAPGIFNSLETRKEGLKPFPKWNGALEKYFEERMDTPGSCGDAQFNRCHYLEWQAELERLRDRDPKSQMKEINKFMNGHRYIVDPVNWGVLDYWASPGEFFRRQGDCEDYAIAKYLSLKILELPADEMRIVILNDLNLRVAHAILAIYIDSEVMVLDNQLSIMIEARRIRHYQPIYSVNETGWWKHKPVG
jgi:predicted transglutaminase-like cysteine proteinase